MYFFTIINIIKYYHSKHLKKKKKKKKKKKLDLIKLFIFKFFNNIILYMKFVR